MNARYFALLTALFVLTLCVAWQFQNPLDYVVYDMALSVATPAGDYVIDLISDLGNGFVILAVSLAVAAWGQWKGLHKATRIAFLCLYTYVIGGVASQGLKHLLGRPRPAQTYQFGESWGPSTERAFDAFPSGHATTAFGLAVLLSFCFPRFRILFLSLALFMAMMRVLQRSHWLTDVIAGALLGSMVGLWVALQAHRRSPLVEPEA